MTVIIKPDSEVPRLPEAKTWRECMPLGKHEITVIFTCGYLYLLLVSFYLTMWTSLAVWIAYLIFTMPELATFLVYKFDLLPEDVEQAEEEEQELPPMPEISIMGPIVIAMNPQPASETQQTAEQILLVQSVLGTEEKQIVTKEEFLFEACYKISALPKSQRSEQAAFVAKAHEIIKPARWRR